MTKFVAEAQSPTGAKCCGVKALDLVVRTYRDGRREWGYACRCGRVYEAKGRLSEEKEKCFI